MKNRQLSFFRFRPCRQQKTSILWFLAVFWFSLPVPAVLAGVIVQEKVELVGMETLLGDEVSRRSRVITNYYQDKRMRLEADEVIFIIDLKKALMITIDVKEKRYKKIALDPVRKLQEQADQLREIYKQQHENLMKRLPPEKQASMEEKFAALPIAGLEKSKDQKVEVKPTGREKQINGYPCDEFEIYKNKKKSVIYWLTSSVATTPMDAFQQELSQWLKGTSSPLQTIFHLDWDLIKDKGFPIMVLNCNVEKGCLAYNREVFHVEEKVLDESYFQPPEEYTQAETPANPVFDFLMSKEKTQEKETAGGK